MSGEGTKGTNEFFSVKIIRLLVVLSLVFFSSWALNQFAFPVFDAYSMTLRDFSNVFKGLVLVVVAIVASKAVSPFATRWFFFASAGICLAGCVLFGVGTATGATGAVMVGAIIGMMGSGFAFVLVGIACLDMRLAQIAGVVVGGLVLSYVWRAVALLIPAPLAADLTLTLYFLIVMLAWGDARATMAAMDTSDSIRDAQIVRPSSFVSFGSQIFICLFVFRFMYGIALTLGETNRTPVDARLSFIPVAFIAVYTWWVLRGDKLLGVDFVFRVASLFVLAGLLIVPAAQAVPGGLPNALLYAGSSLFDLVSWYVLIAIGSRNRIGAIAVFSWGSAVMAFGVVLGANTGRLASFETLLGPAAVLVTACTAFVFMAYVVYFVSHHRFSEAIMSVEPVASVEQTPETTDLAVRSAAVAQRFALTPRETEIFNLLARGRNGHFVQNELVISYNTVKTHVAHIYDKLGVHTQQELIDLVEQEDFEEKPSGASTV